jgi:hypothetical protein
MKKNILDFENHAYTGTSLPLDSLVHRVGRVESAFQGLGFLGQWQVLVREPLMRWCLLYSRESQLATGPLGQRKNCQVVIFHRLPLSRLNSFGQQKIVTNLGRWHDQ